MLNKLIDLFAPDEPLPNKFTTYMGERIYDARTEAGMSQQELSKLIYKRQAALSDYENGKAVVNTDTLGLIAIILNKPLEYFYPPYSYQKTSPEDLSPFEDELIKNFRYHIASDQFRKLVIDIIKAVGEFDIDKFVVEQYPISKSIMEQKEVAQKARDARKKK